MVSMMVRVEAVLLGPAVQVELKLTAEGEDVVFDDAIARVVHVDGRVGDAEDDVADDVEAAGVVVGVEAEGEPGMLQARPPPGRSRRRRGSNCSATCCRGC
jgi:hypothetical protein